MITLCMLLTTAYASLPLHTQPTLDLADPGTAFANPMLDTQTAASWQPPDPALPPATLDSIQRLLKVADTESALAEAERFVATAPYGPDRNAAWMVIGMIEREALNYNVASKAFGIVRASRGVLALDAAWYEAEQDMLRGRDWASIRECENIKKLDKTKRFLDRCQRLEATARARLGQRSKALALAKAYDQAHPLAPITEQISLQLALEAFQKDPAKSLRYWQDLAIHHTTPLAGRTAEQKIAELAEMGVKGAVIPSDNASRRARAIRLRDARRRDEAWALFSELRSEKANRGWSEGVRERFGWRTHRWDDLASLYKSRYRKSKRAKDVWMQYRVLSRGGRFREASKLARSVADKHGGSREWRNKEEELGRIALLSKDYRWATEWFEKAAERKGSAGKRSAFYAAFATFMRKHPRDSIKMFSTIIREDETHEVQARYWRARAAESVGRTTTAATDRAWLKEHAPDSWYTSLLNKPDATLQTHSGGWPTLADEEAQRSLTRTKPKRPVFGSWRDEPTSPALGPLQSLTASFHWPWQQTASSDLTVVEPSVIEWSWRDEVPASYTNSVLYQEQQAEQEAIAIAKANPAWPEIAAAVELARVGLYEQSGPLMSATYTLYKNALDNRRDPRHSAAKRLSMPRDDWRSLFAYTRDHHNTARFHHRMWDNVDEPEVATESWRIAHPLAHAPSVWAAGKEYDIDPYLVLGLMRQESTYNPVAVSRVGASGAMQIMPRTGHLMADLRSEIQFTAGDLEDPTLAAKYGIHYLGLLMERFDGAYPLAVASYNGGPFNVSSWRKGTGEDMPMDMFVEHIPYRETRDYVKKVSRGYASYLDLYGTDGAQLVVPATLRGDHPEVVDF